MTVLKTIYPKFRSDYTLQRDYFWMFLKVSGSAGKTPDLFFFSFRSNQQLSETRWKKAGWETNLLKYMCAQMLSETFRNFSLFLKASGSDTVFDLKNNVQGNVWLVNMVLKTTVSRRELSPLSFLSSKKLNFLESWNYVCSVCFWRPTCRFQGAYVVSAQRLWRLAVGNMNRRSLL